MKRWPGWMYYVWIRPAPLPKALWTAKKLLCWTSLFEAQVPKALASLTAALEGISNATFTAIAAKFTDPAPWRAGKQPHFSSRTKWSGATFEDQGTYILGAAEFVMPARDHTCKRPCMSTAATTGYCFWPSVTCRWAPKGCPPVCIP